MALSPAHAMMITTIEEDLARHDQVYDAVADRREGLIDKLGGVVSNLNLTISEADDPAVISAKLGVVKVYMAALNDQAKDITRRVSVKQKQGEMERDDNTAGLIASFLRETAGQQEPPRLAAAGEPDHTELGNAIEERFLAGGGQIPDTELRADPSDLS